MKLLLVRHGDTDFNRQRRFMGYTAIPLSPPGVKQVQQLCDNLTASPIQAVFTSDLRRTRQTAEILTAGRNLEITLCPELREVNYGLCEGLSFGEISEKYPEVAARCIDFSLALDFPGGENFRGFIRRARGFTKRLKPLPPEATVLIVSHNGPLKVLICHYLGLPLRHWQRLHLDTASLSIIYVNAGGAVLTRLNDVSHLNNM